jgi:hypothetical protein
MKESGVGEETEILTSPLSHQGRGVLKTTSPGIGLKDSEHPTWRGTISERFQGIING